jgi:mannose-6-phosphate isomerase-like protein (cupin superfamily)
MSFGGSELDLTWTMTEAGAAYERGAVESERVLYMVSGRMRLTVGSEETELVAAEMVAIPAGAVVSSVTSGEASVDLTIGRPS